MLYCALAYWIDKWSLLTGSSKPPAYDADIMLKTMRFVPLFAFMHIILALLFLSNQDVFPSDWSVLMPVAEKLFFISEADYNIITRDWASYDSDQRVEHASAFLYSRMLDFSRKSVWLLMCLFIVSIVLLVLASLYSCLLAPVLAPVTFLAKQKCCKCLTSHENDEDVNMTYDVAKAKFMPGMPESYNMKDGREKYRTAAVGVMEKRHRDAGGDAEATNAAMNPAAAS